MSLAPHFPFRGLGEPGTFMGYVLLMGLLPNPSGVLTSVSPKSCRCLGLLDPEPDSGPFRDLVGVLIELFTGCYLGS